MKNFISFQRSTNPNHLEFSDMEKQQKATYLDLSNFKMSTTNNFSTMNDILDSRGSVSKGNTKGLEEDMIEVKKSIK